MAGTGTRPTRRWGLLFALFFLSGISGLIYESIWSRYIRLFVGSAATAQILVLSLFMGGMSLGALLAGRYVSRIRTPIVLYGVIEGLVGLYALAFPYLQAFASTQCYEVIFPALGGGILVTMAKWAVAGLLILPPCLLLGTTFPLMSVGILRRDLAHSGEVLSLLYFTNSLGASFGAVFSGFVLVAWVGLPGALMVAAALNLLIMVVAVRDRTPTPPIVERPDGREEGTPNHAPLRWLFLAVAFGTGMSSFMYEIGWIRLLSMILGSATHSFEVMLSAFVLGLALGGLWVRRRMDKFKRPELVLGIVQILMGLSAVATLPAYLLAVEAMHQLLSGAEIRTEFLWLQFNILRYLLCLLVMLPATFCAGMTLPLLTHVLLKRGGAEKVVGQVYGLNTLGAIFGAVTAGLILMPLVQLKGVIVVGALLDCVLGLYLLRSEILSGHALRGTSTLIRTAAVGTVLTLGFGLMYPIDPMVLTSTVFRRGRKKLNEGYKVLSYVDGRTATVTVVENTMRPGYHIIYTNGKPDASVVLDRWPQGADRNLGPDMAGDEPTQFLLAIVPLMARPQARHAAVIGFGSGVTVHTMLGSANLQRVDTVEIEPEMVRGARFFRPVNWRAYGDARSHIHFDDAKAYFASAKHKFDIIVSEPTNPWVSGVSSLFTVEFYRDAKRYLNEGGLLAQWVQGYELSDELLVTVLAAIDQEFDDYLIVRIGSRDWVIVSSPHGPVGPLSAELLNWPGLQDSFGLLGVHDVGQIDALVVANKALLHPFISRREPNRDMMPLLDTGAEKARFMRESAEFLNELRWTPAPIMAVLAGQSSRPYPLGGIGDLRDPHIMRESEHAALLLRAMGEPAVAAHDSLSPAIMRVWEAETERVAQGQAQWEAWLAASYAVYEVVAPFQVVHETKWWGRTLEVARDHDPPARVAGSLELLDALSRQDGERLHDAVIVSFGDPEHPLPRTLRAIAGLISLELTGASSSVRRAFVGQYMDDLGAGVRDDDGSVEVSSADYAIRVLRAHAMR
ncbi:MAG: hypothetical protein JKY37_31055 [Nannocystaceae bacterium]|nr:hypothetical protein [Nannocystaceae bacterium]